MDSALAQIADNDLGLEQLDPDGNVILLVEGQNARRFLVSSKVLTLASPMLAKLFSSNFYEGEQIASSHRPTIPLHGDDPAAMRTILEILHYREPEQVDPMDAERLAVLAINCDKYDCIKALRPWIINWFYGFPSLGTAEEYGYLLLAAHLFRSAEQFTGISVKAQTRLSPDFFVKWEVIDMLRFLPDGVRSDLANGIEKVLYQIHEELQSVEGRLRADQRCHAMQGRICMICGRTHPISARKCHPCGNSDLYIKHCTSDYRVAEYFNALRKSSLWPSLEPFQNCSAEEIALYISHTKSFLRHSCEAESSCPLHLEFDLLLKRVNGILGRVKGLSLYPLHGTPLRDERT
ncbi:uncharacterized protein BDW43DRAFT_269478 [Aspergillus alliaceus]|uniref:uncharacterized protein n=1 Tax=Petromyces alliaceus TaxID=209559 RepID=UPI0012A4E6F3|nr:uncharacterized protein BDW43DRAFT_269478 [Aspergillus alliaceus]KAB8235721.1 hypothetical protein BDW43DRAFT_269478 [Aspergillus alliaceus]